MFESEKSEKKEPVVDEVLVNKVREILIRDLEEAAKIYGPEVSITQGCLDAIEELKQGKPSKMGGPFFSDYLWSAIEEVGLSNSGDTKEKFEMVRKIIEGD